MGRIAVCTQCHETFQIGEARPPFSWKQTDLAEDSWIGVEPPKEKPEREDRRCFKCDAPMEPGMVRCPECGANQVTGVVYRRRIEHEVEKSTSFWAYLPWRWLIAAAGLAVLVGLGWGVVSTMKRSTVDLGEQLMAEKMLVMAAQELARGGDEFDIAGRFAGKVTDDNVAYYLGMLAARDEIKRHAVAMLIGCGRLTQVGPIVERAEIEATSAGAYEALYAIGPRRLAELAGAADSAIRSSAAMAMCILFNIERRPATLRELSEPVPAAEKIVVLNRICRPWPQAVGAFQVVVGNARSPFTVFVEQIGLIFYMKVGSMEFRTSRLHHRTFIIPIEWWCAATGQAVDVSGLRQLVEGTVTLSSPLGVDWQGTIHVAARQPLRGDLPGFTPFSRPQLNVASEMPVRLSRPGGQ